MSRRAWPIVPLAQVAHIVSGITLGRKTNQTSLIPVPYLRVANVQDGRLELSEVKTVEATASEIEKWRLVEGDLLLTEGGDIDKLGRGACWQDELPLCIHQNHIFRVRLPREHYEPAFVSAQVGSEYGKAYFLARAKKTTGIATINQQVLGKFPLLSPPLDEQRRIAARLKAQLTAVDDLRGATQSQLSDLTHFGNALIQQTLQSRGTERASLGDVLEEVKLGIGVDWSEYPVLGATRDGLAPAKEPVGKNPDRYKPVTVGSIFYNPMRIMIGSIAMVDDGDAPGITSPDYVVLRGRQGIVDARWFYWWLRSPDGERCITSLARGAVRERMLFNRLAEGQIDLPPYPVQLSASKVLALIRPMRATIRAQLREVTPLLSRLLSREFDDGDT